MQQEPKYYLDSSIIQSNGVAFRYWTLIQADGSGWVKGTSFFFVPAGDHRCQDNQFQCKNKMCIPVSSHCDGVEDCSDGSDEDDEICSQKTCAPGQFQCANKRCIPMSYVCDVQNDCGDGSDEPFETCSKLPHENMLQCLVPTIIYVMSTSGTE